MASAQLAYGVDKCPETYDEYSFTLPELYRHVAKEELREDDDVREKAFSEMRQWIADNPHIRKCRTDAKFLLRFLRFCQFSVPMACEALERYLTLRALYPSWFTNLDCTEPVMQEILDNEPFMHLGQDAAGRAVFLVRFGQFQSEQSSLQDIRYIALVLESVLEWEELQVGGLQVLVDYSGCSMSHFEKFSIHELQVGMDMYSRSYPLRYAAIHAAKLPKFALPLLDTFLSFANPKMREKIQCYATVDDLGKHFETPLKPSTYGGSAEFSEMSRAFRKRLEEQRQIVLGLDRMEVDVDYYASMWNLEEIPEEVSVGVMLKQINMK
uniref:CRAL-TRIO domain-containing protein n=1 Tax=Anopheles dirus TaxID=7168 RepID=A0A182N7S9_9DIPT